MKEDIPPYELISPRTHSKGIYIPNWLRDLTDLSLQAKYVYGHLVSYAGEKDYAFPSQERMGKDLNMAPRTIQRILLELREYGLIWRRQMGLGRSNVYYFCNHPCRNEILKEIPEEFPDEVIRYKDDYDSIFNDSE